VVPSSYWFREVDNDVPVIAKYGAASSGNTYANQVAVEILKEGGNAVDASIAAALLIGVRNPFASGIGGGGVMLIHLANGTDFTIDCRETAPATSYPEIYQDNPLLSQRMGLSIGVPGELMCMEHAWRNYGSLKMGTGRISWQRLFRDAINTARDGFVVTPLLASRIASNATIILADPGLRSVFGKNDTAVVGAGDTIVMPLLAETLSTVSRSGIRAFYNGSLTSTVVSEINSFGGKFSLSDIWNYTIDMNGVYNTTYHDYRVVGAPLPFAGSIMLMQSLNILETFNLGTAEGYDSESLHLIIEAAKFGFGNRMMLGDPKFSNLTDVITKMLSKERAQRVLAPQIDPTRTFPSLHYIDLGDDGEVRNKKKKSYVWPNEDRGTTHISVVDVNRMAVAFTTSINWGWGSGCLGNSTGIIYNNELDDFSQPQQTSSSWPNDPVNFPNAGKRPLSSMTPTLVFDKLNRLVFVAGGAGGPKIFSGTLQTFLNLFEFGYNVRTSAQLPRLHNQLNPDVLLYESFMVPDVINALAHIGHDVKAVDTPFNYINTIQVKYTSGGNSTLEADSDWRKDAISKGYKRDPYDPYLL